MSAAKPVLVKASSSKSTVKRRVPLVNMLFDLIKKPPFS
jgi:hypothetical protein